MIIMALGVLTGDVVSGVCEKWLSFHNLILHVICYFVVFVSFSIPFHMLFQCFMMAFVFGNLFGNHKKFSPNASTGGNMYSYGFR